VEKKRTSKQTKDEKLQSKYTISKPKNKGCAGREEREGERERLTFI
jgi:hypothetical protein